MEALIKASLLAYTEIYQFHHTAYPDCKGGCPAHEALDELEKALAEQGVKPNKPW